MRLLFRIVGLLSLVVVASLVNVEAQVKAKVFLADVKSVYVDETSFEIVRSSCERQYGGLTIVCQKHIDERVEFLEVLKRWLGKRGLTVVSDRDTADSILQGTLSTSDPTPGEPMFRSSAGSTETGYAQDKNDYTPWVVDAWLLNQNGHRLWTIRDPVKYPSVNFSANGYAKVEGKKLAFAVKHDIKKASK